MGTLWAVEGIDLAHILRFWPWRRQETDQLFHRVSWNEGKQVVLSAGMSDFLENKAVSEILIKSYRILVCFSRNIACTEYSGVLFNLYFFWFHAFGLYRCSWLGSSSSIYWKATLLNKNYFEFFTQFTLTSRLRREEKDIYIDIVKGTLRKPFCKSLP